MKLLFCIFWCQRLFAIREDKLLWMITTTEYSSYMKNYKVNNTRWLLFRYWPHFALRSVLFIHHCSTRLNIAALNAIVFVRWIADPCQLHGLLTLLARYFIISQNFKRKELFSLTYVADLQACNFVSKFHQTQVPWFYSCPPLGYLDISCDKLLSCRDLL